MPANPLPPQDTQEETGSIYLGNRSPKPMPPGGSTSGCLASSKQDIQLLTTRDQA